MLLPRAPYEVAYVADANLIGFAFETQSGEHALGSDQRAHFRTHPNSLSYLPPGCDIYSRSESGGEYLLIRMNGKPLSQRRFNDLVAPEAIAAACMVRKGLLGAENITAVEIAHHTATLVRTVSHELRGYRMAAPEARWMTPHRLRIVDEMIEARRDSRLTVDAVADELKLSTEFFIRAFKAAVGRTPHDYIMERRLSHARQMILRSSYSLAMIAADCGFASHAHMATTFQRRLGISPGALRIRKSAPGRELTEH
jgi:AraC family transcriptional regulator